MAVVAVTNVIVGRNPSGLIEPFEFEITFECLQKLQNDLEWRLVYVGDSEDKTKDQELDCIALGPVERGALKFSLVTEPPDFTKIKKGDIEGITIILLSGLYRHQEFVRIGWYVHNFFPDWDSADIIPDIDTMPLDEIIPKMRRVVLAENPRVTKFNIEWDTPFTDFGFSIPQSYSVPDGVQRSADGGSMSALDARMLENSNVTDENCSSGISNDMYPKGLLHQGIHHDNYNTIEENALQASRDLEDTEMHE